MIGNITKIRLRSYICASSDVFLPSISSLIVGKWASSEKGRCADILSYILSGAPYYVTVWLNKDTTSVVACTQIIRMSAYYSDPQQIITMDLVY